MDAASLAAEPQFEARIRQAEQADTDNPWAFVVLPKEVSARLPRRGRLTVRGKLNDVAFQVLLEPDGQRSHWLRLEAGLLEAAGTAIGDLARLQVSPLAQEPDPDIPADLLAALKATPDARATWDDTTNLARVDWIHWISSAKRAQTRAKRIKDACEMLAAGKPRVCCFDPSGYYSKAFRAPKAVEP